MLFMTDSRVGIDVSLAAGWMVLASRLAVVFVANCPLLLVVSPDRFELELLFTVADSELMRPLPGGIKWLADVVEVTSADELVDDNAAATSRFSMRVAKVSAGICCFSSEFSCSSRKHFSLSCLICCFKWTISSLTALVK